MFSNKSMIINIVINNTLQTINTNNYENKFDLFCSKRYINLIKNIRIKIKISKSW